MYGGYCGKLLRVDLTREKISDEALPEELAEKFLGGAGIASKLLFDEVPPTTVPLSPENKLILMTGPFGGTPVPAGSRFVAVFKSPQTDAYGEANSGGRWGAELKWAGYDGVIIEGKASSPKVLVITNERANLQDASHIWGKGTIETETLLWQELADTRFSILSIGPAGENLVAFSALINDGGRAAARTGPGAVMGSKKLKAIAVRGRNRPALSKPTRVSELNKSYLNELKNHKRIQVQGANGTIGGFLNWVHKGYGIVKDWQNDLSEWDEREKVSGQVLNKDYLIRRYHCFACPIGCGRIVRNPLDGKDIHGPEYESAATLAAQCCMADMDGLVVANHLCNDLGMDTISTGTSIAFSMECYERGLIPKDILEGQQLRWGDKELILGLIQDIALKRTKLGELLSSGVKQIAHTFGNTAEDFAPHVKGVEFPAHDPRCCQSWGLVYVTGSAGARHVESPVWPETLEIPAPHLGISEVMDRKAIEGKPKAVKLVQDYVASALNSCGCCYFVYGMTDPADYVVAYLEAVIGRQTSLQELLLCGERTFNVKRAFNAMTGLRREDDVLPKRFTHDSLKAGASQGLVSRVDEMLDEYYELRGWDRVTGAPSRQKLEQLALPEISKSLYG